MASDRVRSDEIEASATTDGVYFRDEVIHDRMNE